MLAGPKMNSAWLQNFAGKYLKPTELPRLEILTTLN